MIATFGKTEAATESIAVQWQLVLHDSARERGFALRFII
jgi:hypothetical protein